MHVHVQQHPSNPKSGRVFASHGLGLRALGMNLAEEGLRVQNPCLPRMTLVTVEEAEERQQQNHDDPGPVNPAHAVDCDASTARDRRQDVKDDTDDIVQLLFEGLLVVLLHPPHDDVHFCRHPCPRRLSASGHEYIDVGLHPLAEPWEDSRRPQRPTVLALEDERRLW